MKLLPLETGQNIAHRLWELSSGGESPKARILLIRGLLEELYKALTQDARVSASGLFARMQYLHDQVSLPDQLCKQANLLRILCNQTAHEKDFQPTQTDFLSACKVITDLLRWYQDALDLDRLDSYLEQNGANEFPDRPHAKRHSFLCAVESWNPLTVGETITGIEIKARDENGAGISLMLRDETDSKGGRKWSLLARCLWKWATINCLNLSESSGPKNQFINNPGTLIVIEPDYLMDVSSIADCISFNSVNPELAVLGRLVSDSATRSLVMGTAVNSVFDDLMFDPEADYNKLFRESLSRSPIPLVALGKEVALEIHATIKDEHLPRLRAMANYVGKLDMMLEPSFISPKYGLQGRLDLLYREKDKYYIVELKSGSAPKSGVWPQHMTQVVGYNMLIRDCYGSAALGTSSILYSRLPEKSLLHVTNTVAQEQDLLMCRNRILGIWKQLAEKPAVFFDWLKAYDGGQLADFAKERLHKVQQLLGDLDPLEYEWFLEQVRLAVRETWYVKIGSSGARLESGYGFNALWQQSREEKLRRYKLLPTLKLLSSQKNILRFELGDKDRISDFREGDVVVAYREDLPVHKQEILRGELIRLTEDSLELRARGVVNPSLLADTQRLWAIEHDMLESMLFGPLASITDFLRSTPEKRRKLIGLIEPEFDALPAGDQEGIDELIDKIDSARDYCVVQGPPGTGKTSGLITKYIKRLYEGTDQTVLVLSFTNRAVDEICANLVKTQIPHIRTGRSQNVTDELLENLIRDKRFDQINEVVRDNRVWVATVQSCNSWINDFIKIKNGIGTLIIDEASQIVESAILGIIVRAERCILIGDQNQLPPIITQSNASYSFNSAELKELCYSSYNRSLMERLFLLCETQNWLQGRHMLQRHFRMHERIADLVQPFYRNGLISSTSRQSEDLDPAPELPDYLSERVLWIECPPATKAFYDELQCRVIHRLLDQLRDHGELTDLRTGAGIVAPYRAMIQALKSELGDPYAQLTIDTVERFQGSERDIIIITLPLRDKTDLRTLEALSDDLKVDRKLNVALSRARERLVILGNASLCSASAHYAFLIDKIRASHRVIPCSQILNN